MFEREKREDSRTSEKRFYTKITKKGWIPASNGLSERISKDLKRRGFKFLGPTTIYSHLQACGIINDHGSDCERYKKIIAKYPTIKKPKENEKDVQYFGDQSA